MKKLPDYEDYKKMIIKRAISFSQSTGIATDELISVGNLCFVESWKKYDPARSKFSTYLWRCLGSAMSDFVKSERRLSRPVFNIVDDDEEEILNEIACTRPSIEHDVAFRQRLGQLSPFSTIAIDAALNGSITEGIGAKGLVVELLRENGASWSAVWNSMREIKSVLQEAI